MNQILDYGENEQNTCDQESINMQSKTMEDYYQNQKLIIKLKWIIVKKRYKKNIKVFAIALGVFKLVPYNCHRYILFTNKKGSETRYY